MIERLPLLPRAVPLLDGADTLYELDLSANPSPAWRAAFLRPPPRTVSARYSPEVGRVGFGGNAVHFRTTPDQLDTWLFLVDSWMEYANSVVEE